MPPRALLFDLDGTLIDSDPLHFQTYVEVAERYGVTMTERLFKEQVSGQSNSLIAERLFSHVDPARRPAIADEKEALFRERLEAGAAPIAGLAELLDWAGRTGVAVAVVSNAPRDNITAMLVALGLSGAFPVTISGEELPRGKPDPLPYRTAMDRLGVSPAQSVAFEDAIPGLTAAVAAGATSIGMTTSVPADTLLATGATLAIKDFRDERLWELLKGVRT